MNKQSGFSAIEFVISILISTVLMTASLTIYQYITKSISKIDQTTNADISVTILKNRLSKDLFGLCPLWFNQNDTQSDQNDSKEKKLTPKNTSADILHNNYIYAVSDNKQLNYITFITTSALQTYPDIKKSCIRVVYALKKDPKDESLFILQRKQEKIISNEIDIQKIVTGDFYTIAKNITTCSLDCGFINFKKQQQSKDSDNSLKITWTNSWGDTTQEQNKDKTIPAIPDIIRITITFKEGLNAPLKEYQIYSILPLSKEVSFQSFAQKRKQQTEQKNNSINNIPAPKNQLIHNAVQNNIQVAIKAQG